MGKGKPHVLVIPYPLQGHVLPSMEVSQQLVQNGLKVTFVNTDFNHQRFVKKALAAAAADDDRNHHSNDLEGSSLRFESITDGLEPEDDRTDLVALSKSIPRVMPKKLEELIRKINSAAGTDYDQITCVMTEFLMGWALEVAEKMNIRRALFIPTSVAGIATSLHITKFIDDGIIDEFGTPLRNESFKMSPDMPAMKPSQLIWVSSGKEAQEPIFEAGKLFRHYLKLAEWSISNSSTVLEPAALSLFPDLRPIGPLFANNWTMGCSSASGSFWCEDSSCLNWLDQQAPSSVIYVAFGSIAVFDKTQFQELALGLELTRRPFLWVVRPDIMAEKDEACQEGFLQRVADRGRLVRWAPQRKVLSHPAIACFVSHCGWNSTLVGVNNGLPFLSWPYFADQFLNEIYIVDVWKTGLRLERNENGIITRDEIVAKVRIVIGDQGYKERAVELKGQTMSGIEEGGSSYENFTNFIKWLKMT